MISSNLFRTKQASLIKCLSHRDSALINTHQVPLTQGLGTHPVPLPQGLGTHPVPLPQGLGTHPVPLPLGLGTHPTSPNVTPHACSGTPVHLIYDVQGPTPT
ncbi:hypothetical protein Adt_01162 [Abeliophyllum distichum]|uniref:Uncharacterized protein n=1 Tax=Abeliophyllum distichum TaxID=126358 RepID=A0ABD1VS53_9LAMI